MNKDFRVTVNFLRHIKTQKLVHLLGKESVFSLLSLWSYTAENHPKGTLVGLGKEDIPWISDWSGNGDEFVDALVGLKFLDVEDGVYSIHNWETRNGYVFYADERSEKARKAAKSRWNKQKEDKNLNGGSSE